MVLCGCPLDVGAWLRVLSARAPGDSVSTPRERLDHGFCLGSLLIPWITKNQLCPPVFLTVVRICPFGSNFKEIATSR